jgi:arylsulfatase A-like enzyme
MTHQHVVTLIVFLGLAICHPAKADERPNVLFIAVDDLNDWIGCMNTHPQAHTPNIDRLAARGVLFTNAHCAAPACNPSRAAVFSGQMPARTGVWSNDSPRLRSLQPEAKLLPVTFAKAGYRTLGTGKLLGDSKAFDQYAVFEQRWSPFTKQIVEYSDEELPSKGTDNPHCDAPLGLRRFITI